MIAPWARNVYSLRSRKDSQAPRERHVVARYHMSPLQGSNFVRISRYKHFVPLALFTAANLSRTPLQNVI
jgi:hypothetical protein